MTEMIRIKTDVLGLRTIQDREQRSSKGREGKERGGCDNQLLLSLSNQRISFAQIDEISHLHEHHSNLIPRDPV